jgi:hypothetical protein
MVFCALALVWAGASGAGDAAMRVSVNTAVRHAFKAADVARLAMPGATVVVTVNGHTPAARGAVALEVVATCAGREVSLGNAGVFPALPFTPADTRKVQRFQFPWPLDRACQGVGALTLRVLADGGDGQGAAFEIESITIQMP